MNPSRPLSLAKYKLLAVDFEQRGRMVWIAMNHHIVTVDRA